MDSGSEMISARSTSSSSLLYVERRGRPFHFLLIMSLRSLSLRFEIFLLTFRDFSALSLSSKFFFQKASTHFELTVTRIGESILFNIRFIRITVSSCYKSRRSLTNPLRFSTTGNFSLWFVFMLVENISVRAAKLAVILSCFFQILVSLLITASFCFRAA